MAKPFRKIISVCTGTYTDDLGQSYALIALCDDGSLWKMLPGKKEWHRIDTTEIPYIGEWPLRATL